MSDTGGAKVIVCVIGQEPRNLRATTVGELKRTLGLNGYTASVDGSPANDDTVLRDMQYVSLAPSVKGGE